MKYVLALLLLPAMSHAMITVAVIDTGLHDSVVDLSEPPSDSWYDYGICKYGHKDYTGTDLKDRHGHGTNISGLIHMHAGGEAHCQVVLKYYDPSVPTLNNLKNMIKAIRYAIDINVDIINISGGGVTFSGAEYRLIMEALNKGIIVIAAAGNERSDEPFYPAAYSDKVISVGSLDSKGNRLPSSNYGKYVTTYEIGKNQVGSYGPEMTGTSQATAIRTGKKIKEIYEYRRKKLMELLLQRKAAA
jgi:serine protease